MANSEFWRELKPIEQKFRPGALPEAYIANAPTEDERFYAPLSETVGTRPLWISPSQNRWCDVLMCRGAGLVNRLIWLDENGEPNGTFDVFDYIALCRGHYERNGIGAD